MCGFGYYRGPVTDFLQSGLRDQIDRLMMSRVQTHSNKHSEKWELQQEEEEEEHRNENVEETEEEEPFTEEGEEQDDGDDSSSSPIFASSPAGSWSCQDTEVTSTPVLSVHNPPSPVSVFRFYCYPHKNSQTALVVVESLNRLIKNVFRKWS